MSDPQVALQAIQHRVDSCTRCPFNAETDTRISGGSGGDVRVMFISDAPPSEKGGALHSEGPGEHLSEQARKKANLENAYSTFLIKCRSGNEIPTAIRFARCIDHLREEIEALKPQVVVTVGKEVRINDNGKLHTLDFPNLLREFLAPEVNVTWTYDPAYVFSQKKKKPALVETYFKQHEEIPDLLR